MRSVFSPGNVYYGLFEQVRCKAVFIQQCQDSINKQTFYLVPAACCCALLLAAASAGAAAAIAGISNPLLATSVPTKILK